MARLCGSNIQHSTCNVQRATLSHTECNMQHATLNLSSAGRPHLSSGALLVDKHSSATASAYNEFPDTSSRCSKHGRSARSALARANASRGPSPVPIGGRQRRPTTHAPTPHAAEAQQLQVTPVPVLCGIPCRVGYHAVWDTMPCGIPCRVGYHVVWETKSVRLRSLSDRCVIRGWYRRASTGTAEGSRRAAHSRSDAHAFATSATHGRPAWMQACVSRRPHHHRHTYIHSFIHT